MAKQNLSASSRPGKKGKRKKKIGPKPSRMAEIREEVQRTTAQVTSTEFIQILTRQSWLVPPEVVKPSGGEIDEHFDVYEEYELNDWLGNTGEWENSGVARANHFGGLETDGYLPHPDLVLSRIDGEIEVEVPLAAMFHQLVINDRYGRGTTQRLYASCYLEALKNRVALLYDLGELICKPQDDAFFHAESWEDAEKQLNKTFQKSKVAKQFKKHRADIGRLIDHLWVQFEPSGVVIPLADLFSDGRKTDVKDEVSRAILDVLRTEDPDIPRSQASIAKKLEERRLTVFSPYTPSASI
jgi:DNA-directed RNA polymerase specialized sigma54-like protein